MPLSPRTLRPLRLAIERLLRGPDAAETAARGIAQTIGSPPAGMTSAEYADIALRQLELSQPRADMLPLREAEGALDPKLSPLERGRRLQDSQVPGLTEDARRFLPRDVVVPPPPPPPKGPKAPSSVFDDGDGIPGKGALQAVGLVGDPAFAMGSTPLGKEIHRIWRRARFDGVDLRTKQLEELEPVSALFEDMPLKRRRETSARLFRVLQLSPDSPEYQKIFQQMPAKEKAAVQGVRNILERFRDSELGTQLLEEHIARERSRRGFEAARAGRVIPRLTGTRKAAFERAVMSRFEKKGLLEQVGTLVWKDNDFRYVAKDGTAKLGALPQELSATRTGGNAALAHLVKGMPIHEDILEPIEAITRGIIRRQIYDPAWREMTVASRELPPGQKLYLREWMKELKGIPTLADNVVRTAFETSAGRLGTIIPYSTGQKVSSFVLGAFYRGALFGNLNAYFANFFGQGFLNNAAKHGPMATFAGIARHFNDARVGIPRESIMGGFEALMSHEAPLHGFGAELMESPGIKAFRKFFRKTEEFMGYGATEYVNRSISTNIGLKEALDRYNAFHGTQHTVDQVLAGKGVDDATRNNLLFDALMDSDNVNYVYGVDGRNPFLARILGRGTVAHAFQFLSWAPKTAQFLFGPIIQKGDPGILLNYLLLSGWMSRQVGLNWGIDFGPMTLFGARFPQREFVPLPVGPSVQAFWLLAQGLLEEDETKVKEIWRELGRTLELMIPGDIEARRVQNFWRNIDAEGLLAPSPYGPWTLVHEWGPTAAEQPGPIFGPAGIGQIGGFPKSDANLARNLANIIRSETPARALGVPTLSDRQERRILSEIRRSGSLWRRYTKDLVDEMLRTAQTKGVDSPEFQELTALAAAEGLPVGRAFEEGMAKVLLPRLLRALLEAPELSRYQLLTYINSRYPELFEADQEMINLPFGAQPEPQPEEMFAP